MSTIRRLELIDYLALVLIIIGLLWRFVSLDLKPPHFDEGINGHFVNLMWKIGYYSYDPSNFHGPLYFYLLHLSEVVLGEGIWSFRFMTVLLSIGVVGCILAYTLILGRAALWAGLIITYSPGAFFYARYAIHETLLVLGSVVSLFGLLVILDRGINRSNQWAFVLLLLGFFICLVTKETFFIYFGTILIALILIIIHKGTYLSNFDFSEISKWDWRAQLSKKEYLFLAGVFSFGLYLSIMLFAGFFQDPDGLRKIVQSLVIWTQTGVDGSGHEKEFFYYFKLLWRYELVLIIALFLSVPLYFFVPVSGKIVCLTGFGLFLAYSFIPYKTPWLIINITWLLSLVLGVFIEKVLTLRRFILFRSLIRVSFVLFVLGVSGPINYRLNFVDYENPNEPYVYVQTTNELRDAFGVINRALVSFPNLYNIKIGVAVESPWPLPWMLQRFTNVIYLSKDPYSWAESTVRDFDAVFVDKSSRRQLEKNLELEYIVLPSQMRDSYQKGYLFLSRSIFSDFIETEVYEVFKRGEQ